MWLVYVLVHQRRVMAVKRYKDVIGPALVFVTTTVKDWIPVFSLDPVARTVARQLRETINLYGVALIGYVIMPSHVHAMLGFHEVADLSKVIQAFKSIASRKMKSLNLGDFRRRLTHEGHLQLWKRRFDDLVITSEKQFRIKLDYIHINPVRDQLVGEADEYVFSSARNWLGQGTGIISIDRDYNFIYQAGARGRTPATTMPDLLSYQDAQISLQNRHEVFQLGFGANFENLAY